MANVQIYDQLTGRKYSITVDAAQAVINGSSSGENVFYMSLTTNAKDPLSQAIQARILTDSDIGLSDFTVYIKAKIVEILTEINGGYLSSSSSDSSISSISSISSMTPSSVSSVSSIST